MRMHLIEIFLPLYDNEGRRFGAGLYAEVREELVARFGGLTAFSRSPAEGLWEDGGERSRDDILILEVMADTLDREWWRGYREALERRFRQDEIMLRAQTVERL